jgi:hypothetical protein
MEILDLTTYTNRKKMKLNAKEQRKPSIAIHIFLTIYKSIPTDFISSQQ